MVAARKAKKTSAKPSSKKASATRKKVTKATKAIASKKAPARKKAKAKPARNSVDSILASFDKQRNEQQTKLNSVRKKIAQLEAKTKAFQAEIVSLKETEAKAETIIGTLDIDRDQAVREVLGKLGVKLEKETPAKSKKKKAKASKSGATKKKTSKTRARKKSSDSTSAWAALRMSGSTGERL